MKLTAPRRLHWLLLLSIVIILLDRLTKTWVALRIPMGGAIPVIPRVLRITHWTNEGAAFSLFADSPHAVHAALIGFNCIALVAVFVAMIRLGNRFTFTTVALALIFPGALGNLQDRLAYGSVT